MVSGEKIIYRAKPHWIYLLTPAIITAIGLSCTCCSLAGTAPRAGQQPPSPEGTQLLLICSGGILILALLITILDILGYRTAGLTLTDRRVIAEGGILSRRSKEILLNKVESVYVDQGLLGRLLGYGTMVITGSGGSREVLKMVTNPMEIRQQVLDQVSRL